MNRFAIILAIFATALLSSCGGVPQTPVVAAVPVVPVTPTPTPPTPTPTPAAYSIDWQFNTTSTTGRPSVKISGSISQPDNPVTAAMHVDGSTCFDRLTTIGLTGSLTGGALSLTSASVGGQILTLAGTVTLDANNGNDVFTGTYSINGGCDDGDKGTATGTDFYINDALDGTFTSSQNQPIAVSGGLGQYSVPNSDGSFGMTGGVTVSTPCFPSGTITPGTLSSGSFILGTTVGLEVDNANGTLTFLGTVDLDSFDPEFSSYLIRGTYSVSGSTCDGTGTAVLRVYNPWDY